MSLCPEAVLITGANRGIGLEFVKQFAALAKPPKHIFAGCRTPDQAKSPVTSPTLYGQADGNNPAIYTDNLTGDLKALADKNKTIVLVQLDVSDVQSIKKSVSAVQGVVGDKGLNLIVNNAGILPPDNIENVTPEIMMNVYTTNTIGPLMVVQSFLPLLKAAAAKDTSSLSTNKASIINISTGLASIADNTSGGMYAYRCSKVALNMLTRSLGMDLKKFGILATAVHPGFVATDMTKMVQSDKKISPEESVSSMMKVMAKGNGGDINGKNFSFTGEEFPW